MNTRQFLKGLLYSLGLASFIASLFGAGTWVLGVGFLPGFILSIALQFLYASIANPIRQRKDVIKLAELEASYELAESQQFLDIQCAYCKRRNVVPILLNTSNVFDCEKCSETSAIQMFFESVRITTPLVTEMDKKVIDELQKEEDIDDAE